MQPAALSVTADTTSTATTFAGSLRLSVTGVNNITIDWFADLRVRPFPG